MLKTPCFNKEGTGKVVMRRKLTSFNSVYNPYAKKNVRFPPSFPKGCPDIYPRKEKPATPKILKADTFQYVAFSDGIKRIYTNQDGLTGYGNTGIMNPNSVSYINLFINAMLQPPSLYQVREGVLVLTSQDVPQKGVPIVLQFIMIYES